MSSTEVLRRQKSGLMMRLSEQKRSLERLVEDNNRLVEEKKALESTVAGLSKAWNVLDANLAGFAMRFEDSEEKGSLANVFRSIRIGEDSSQFESRAASTTKVVEKLSSLISRNAPRSERLEEMHTAFAGLTVRFAALTEQCQSLSDERDSLRAKMDAQLLELRSAERRCERLTEELQAAKAEQQELRTSGILQQQQPMSLTQSIGENGGDLAEEPMEKKRKSGDDVSDNVNEVMNALKAENMRLMEARDAMVLSAKSVSEEAIRQSSLYAAQQATIAWHVKEQTAHVASLQQISDSLAVANESHKFEREKMSQWRKDFERQTNDMLDKLRKEISNLRVERDELKEKLEDVETSSSKDTLVSEVKALAALQARQIADLQDTVKRKTNDLEKLEARLKLHEEIRGEGKGSDEKTRDALAQLEALKGVLAVEQKRNEMLRQEAGKAEEKLRESSVILGVWKKSAADKRELTEVKESEALLKHRNAELNSKLESLASEAGTAFSKEKKVYEALVAEQMHAQARTAEEHRQRHDEMAAMSGTLREELRIKTEENEALMSEMGNIVAGLEELQKQNERLLEELLKKDDTHAALVQQKSISRQMETLLAQEKNELTMRMSTLKKLAATQKSQMAHQAEANDALEQAMHKLREENQLLSTALEREKAQVKEFQRLVSEAKAKAEEAEKGKSEMAAIVSETQKRARELEQRNLVLSGQAAHLDQTVSSYRTKGADVLMQEQLQSLKTAARCSICNNTYKNTVLTTCFHTFCRECVQDLISNRSRKCPRCGRPFDKVDVKTVYLDFDELN